MDSLLNLLGKLPCLGPWPCLLYSNIGSWQDDGRRLVGYWIGRQYWGRGVATQALARFVARDPELPFAYRLQSGRPVADASHSSSSLARSSLMTALPASETQPVSLE